MVRYDLNLFEVWKPIPDCPGYEISSYGRVWNNKKGLLHTRKEKKGYMLFNVSINGKTYTKKVHRVVAQAFIPNPDNLPQVNHKDEDKSNNYVVNLEWCTAKYNCNFGTRIQRQIQTKINKGLYNPLTAGLYSKTDRDKVYRELNSDRLKVYQKNWRESHKEYIKQYNKEYYDFFRKNREIH